MAQVHPTAVIADGAKLEAGVEIGPYCVIGPRVRLGADVKLSSHVVVDGDTEIGSRTIVYSHAVLGGPAQYRNESNSTGMLRIGVENVVREHVTMNVGTRKGSGVTTVGDRGYFMSFSHVAHDCSVGNAVTFANGVTLAGHVSVADGVNIGGLAAVLQHVRVGRDAFVGGVSGLTADVVPYGLVHGSRARLEGLNLIGLKRKGLSRERIFALRKAFRFVFYGDGQLRDRAREAKETWADHPEACEIAEFILADLKRPICVPGRNGDDEDER